MRKWGEKERQTKDEAARRGRGGRSNGWVQKLEN